MFVSTDVRSGNTTQQPFYMLKKITTGLFLLAVLWANQAFAQGSQACANARTNSNMRTALANANQQRLMNKYDINFYKLDVALERTSTYIAGNALIQARTKTIPLDTFAFELHQNLAIDSIIINGTKRTFTRQTGMTYVRFLTPVPANSPINATIFYKGTPPTAGAAAIGEGMTSATSPSWGNRVTWSLSQPFSAYEWFPCKQVLTDKADSVEVWVTTSPSNKAGSNGVLKQTTTLPNGKKRYEWKSRYPIDYYLISVAVAEYNEYTIFANPVGAPNPIPIVNYIYNNPGTLPQFQAEINNTAPMLVKFSELYGLYPFYKEKYGHCMAPLSGGMEHQTMTTQGFFEFTLTAHELAHQWFGDNVTCASWRDIWLNEGFASYSEYVALENLRPTQKRAWMDNTHSSVLSNGTGSVYIPAADSMNVGRIFNSRLTYDKGATVVHMLRFEFNNDSLFFAALRAYQQQFKDGTAKTADFKQVVETVSGKNLTPFFNQWVYGEGHPTFDLIWNQTGKHLLINSIQTPSAGAITPLFETDVELKLVRSIGDTIIRVRQDQLNEFFSVKVSGAVSSIEIDPNQWILNMDGVVSRDANLVNGTPSELAAEKIKLYPNPATAFLTISDLGFRPQFIQVYDAAGRCVKNLKASGFDSKIKVNDLAEGFYLLKVGNAENVITKPFQKL
ncbi:T9SS type A sorting domain-containing protein [Adhaeribacter sp. BT258]|uniref:Aminopeptidase N n=1 Tax=Adhaeribacter terrigena TaxID=2793070 RepID=A0ABS1C278_9BACT|nr:M1 family aminopeptidase [Adhaeribacter terrigena]MBK0402665.1 T9SS type A sorting domain-containing protein [Adhaeribacter terrigena]